MEDTKKNEMWGKVMAPLAGFLAIVLAAFLIILKLLESGVIGTVMDLRDRGFRVRRNLHGDQVDSGSDQIRD